MWWGEVTVGQGRIQTDIRDNGKNAENKPEENICMDPSTFCVDQCLNPCKKIAGTMRFCCLTVFLEGSELLFQEIFRFG